MKKLIASICALALLAQTSCAMRVKSRNTPAPTEKITEAPTETPTDEPTELPSQTPTETPTESPTETPTASQPASQTAPPTPALVFPTPGRTGNLIGGALFDDSAKYFVLPGEAAMHYVYNEMGELVDIFSAPESEDIEGERNECHGFFGEHGICYGYSLREKRMLPRFFEFQGNTYVTADGNVFEIRDGLLENPMRFSGGTEQNLSIKIDDEWVEFSVEAYSLGECGCVFRLDDRYLIFKAFSRPNDEGDPNDEDWHWYTVGFSKGALLDAEGRLIEEDIDMSVFGNIKGVFGDRYIVADKAIFTLEGEKVMDGVKLIEKGSCSFSVMDGDGHIGYSYGDYIVDESGVCYDRDLNDIKQPAEDEIEKFVSPFDPIRFENRQLVYGEVYSGVKDGAGNWLFRIYSPKNAGDSLNPAHDRMPDWWNWDDYWD